MPPGRPGGLRLDVSNGTRAFAFESQRPTYALPIASVARALAAIDPSGEPRYVEKRMREPSALNLTRNESTPLAACGEPCAALTTGKSLAAAFPAMYTLCCASTAIPDGESIGSVHRQYQLRLRSEERRVGKECRFGGSLDHLSRKKSYNQ